MSRPTIKELRMVGRIMKAADPETVARLREDGDPINLEALGRYVLAADPDQFDRIVEDEGRPTRPW